jgi:hypothetical protein
MCNVVELSSMNTIMNIRRFLLALAVLSACVFICSCGQENEYRWQADRSAEGDFTLSNTNAEEETDYILNASSRRIHRSDCRYAQTVAKENRVFTNDYQRALAEGYSPCSVCHPKGK